MKPFPVGAIFEIKSAMDRVQWAAYYCLPVARELGLLAAFIRGDPKVCDTLAQSLDVVVAAMERQAAMGAGEIGRECALATAKLFSRKR